MAYFCGPSRSDKSRVVRPTGRKRCLMAGLVYLTPRAWLVASSSIDQVAWLRPVEGIGMATGPVIDAPLSGICTNARKRREFTPDLVTLDLCRWPPLIISWISVAWESANGFRPVPRRALIFAVWISDSPRSWSHTVLRRFLNSGVLDWFSAIQSS